MAILGDVVNVERWSPTRSIQKFSDPETSIGGVSRRWKKEDEKPFLYIVLKIGEEPKTPVIPLNLNISMTCQVWCKLKDVHEKEIFKPS